MQLQVRTKKRTKLAVQVRVELSGATWSLSVLVVDRSSPPPCCLATTATSATIAPSRLRSVMEPVCPQVETYAGEIRAGKSLPHPRHWQKLAELAGASKAPLLESTTTDSSK